MLNWFDYALLLVLGVSMAVGLWRGFVVEVLSLTVWVAAFWLAIGFGAEVAARLTGIESDSARMLVGHVGVFLGVLVLGGLLTWAIGKVIANTGLSGTDRILGVGFGLLRGLVLVCVAVLMMGFTPMPQEPWWSESRLLPRVQAGAEWMTGFLPPDAAKLIDFELPSPMAELPFTDAPPAATEPPSPET
jgi:membrane protein required for colicin V production